jgi:hypothetical protein
MGLSSTLTSFYYIQTLYEIKVSIAGRHRLRQIVMASEAKPSHFCGAQNATPGAARIS